MRIVLCLLFTCSGLMALAQDPEFPDYRPKKDNFLKMQEKDLRKDIASFAIAGLDERMNSTPVKSVPAVNFGSNFIKFEGGDVQVTITAGIFDPKKHKLSYYDENKYLVKIDGKPYFGDYGSMPKATIASVTVVVGKDTIPIPSTAYFDLYSPLFTYNDGSVVRSHDGVYLSSDKHTMYIYMLNKEGNGNYEVTWVIQDKKYLRRVVDGALLK